MQLGHGQGCRLMVHLGLGWAPGVGWGWERGGATALDMGFMPSAQGGSGVAGISADGCQRRQRVQRRHATVHGGGSWPVSSQQTRARDSSVQQLGKRPNPGKWAGLGSTAVLWVGDGARRGLWKPGLCASTRLWEPRQGTQL